jgi:hypothetical protein
MCKEDARISDAAFIRYGIAVTIEAGTALMCDIDGEDFRSA